MTTFGRAVSIAMLSLMVKSASCNAQTTDIPKLTFYRQAGSAGEIRLEWQPDTLVENASEGQYFQGKLRCVLNNEEITGATPVGFSGKITNGNIVSGKLKLLDDIRFATATEHKVGLTLNKEALFEKKNGKCSFSGSTSLSFLEKSDIGKKFTFRAENLNVDSGGISGRIHTNAPISSIKFPQLKQVYFDLLSADIEIEQNALKNFRAIANLHLPRRGDISEGNVTNVALDCTYGNGMGLVFNGVKDKPFTLGFGAGALKVKKFTLDLSSTYKPCSPPGYWNDSPSEWQGLFVEDAELNLPDVGNLLFTTTSLYFDENGPSGNVSWSKLNVNNQKIAFGVEPGALEFDQGQVIRGKIQGQLRLDESLFQDTRWIHDPMQVNWSVDINDKTHVYHLATTEDEPIVLSSTDDRARLVLAVSSGTFSTANNETNLSGTIRFVNTVDKAALKSASFQFRDFKIKATGAISFPNQDIIADPVEIEAGPCELTINSAHFAQQPNGTLVVDLSGGLRLTPASPLRLKNATSTAKVSLLCDGRTVTPSWKECTLNVDAQQVLGMTSLKSAMQLQRTDDGELCLFGKADVDFKNFGGASASPATLKLNFLLTKNAWYVGGKQKIPGGIELGNTGIRLYNFRGGMGQNAVFDIARDYSDASQISLITSDPKPRLEADVVLASADKTSCWGMAKMVIEPQQGVKMRGQIHLMSSGFNETDVDTILERGYSPHDPQTALVDIVWDQVSKGFLIDLDANITLQWATRTANDIELRATGKTQLFISHDRASLRVGSIDSLADSGVVVRTSDGSTFKSALYVELSPQNTGSDTRWKISQAEVGVLWNKDYPLYDGWAAVNGELEGSLHYFADKTRMNQSWQDAIDKEWLRNKKWQEEVMGRLSRPVNVADLPQDSYFVGRIRGKLGVSLFIANVQAKGEAIAFLTDSSLFMKSNATLGAGLFNINIPFARASRSKRFAWNRRSERSIGLTEGRPEADTPASHPWRSRTNEPGSFMSVSLSPAH